MNSKRANSMNKNKNSKKRKRLRRKMKSIISSKEGRR
jgi:hypothetical protein